MSAVAVLAYQSTAANAVTITPPSGTSPYSYQLQRAPDVSGSAGSYANKGSALAAQTTTATMIDKTGVADTPYWYRVVVTDSANTPVVTNSNGVKARTGGYPFTGLRAYITAAAGSHSAASGRFVPAATRNPVVARVNSLLGQASYKQGPGGIAAADLLITEAMAWRDTLMLAVDAIEGAINDVVANTGATAQTYAKTANES